MASSRDSDAIGAYIDAAPAAARKKLRELRASIQAVAPGAVEGLKWGMPAFSYKRVLVTFAVFKNHIGFYPTPSAVKKFRTALKGYETSSAAIQFPLDKALPLPLIRKITRFRVKQALEEDGKWRT